MRLIPQLKASILGLTTQSNPATMQRNCKCESDVMRIIDDSMGAQSQPWPSPHLALMCLRPPPDAWVPSLSSSAQPLNSPLHTLQHFQ